MATSQIETVSTGADKAKLAVAVVLAVGAIVAFYLLSRQGSVVQWAALLVGLAAAVAAFGSSESGRQLWAFGRDSWREVKKVVWPTRRETIMTGIMVVIMTTILALFFLGVDTFFNAVVQALLKLAK